MIEIKLTIDGKKQAFKKREITIRDNIFAVKHQILATQYYSDTEKANDPDEYEKIQLNFAKTIAQIFGNEFTADQLLDGLGSKESEVLNEIYLQALGGTVDEDVEKKVSEPITPEEAYESLRNMMQGLMKAGYKLPEILEMSLADIGLFTEILDESSTESELTEDFLGLLM